MEKGKTDVDHVVDDRGLGDLLGSELSGSVQISSVVVSQVVVRCRIDKSAYPLEQRERRRRTGNRERLDSSRDEVIRENGFNLSVTPTSVTNASRRVKIEGLTLV